MEKESDEARGVASEAAGVQEDLPAATSTGEIRDYHFVRFSFSCTAPLLPPFLSTGLAVSSPHLSSSPSAESSLSKVDHEWGNAATTEESIEKWTAADVFRPDELVEWRAPAKDEAPLPSLMEDKFVILSLTHIMCGLRMDASDFLLSVLGHYGIEWFHLTPNSITALSIFAHLCEAYLGEPPTVEVFAHFYRPYHNNKGETTTLGAVYFRLRDKMKNYPVYYLKATQFVWTCLWFYAKIPQSCRLTFRGDALKETNNWSDVLHLSPEQQDQVRRIGELSNQGLTGVDIINDFLKPRISPLRRRAHLACNYTGPTDPTRDSDEGAYATFTRFAIMYHQLIDTTSFFLCLMTLIELWI